MALTPLRDGGTHAKPPFLSTFLTAMKPLYPRTICADGTTLSIQASEFHYCSPRDNSRDPWWNYNLVELGYPENADGTALILPDTFATYADGNYPSNVYGYVPIDLVLTFIEQHGGIADS